MGIIAGRIFVPGSAVEENRSRRYNLKVNLLPAFRNIVISTDGQKIIYPGTDPQMLYVRDLDSFGPVSIPGTEGAHCATLSPDGEWVAFTTDTQIRKVRIEGGTPVTLHDFAPVTVEGNRGEWAEDGTIYFGLWHDGDYGVIFQLPASGGKPKPTIERDNAEGVPTERNQPQLVGDFLIYTAVPGNRYYAAANSQLRALDLRTGEERILLEPAAAGRFLRSGHLISTADAVRFSVTPVDPKTLQVTGPSATIPEEIETSPSGMAARLEVSPSGMAVFQPAFTDENEDRLMWLDWKGGRSDFIKGPDRFLGVTVSPSGRLAAVISEDKANTRKLNVLDLERQSLRTLVNGKELPTPVWSPDEESIYYVDGAHDSGAILYRIKIDGSARAEEIARLGTPWFNITAISPDGDLVAGHIWDPESEMDMDLWIAPTDGSEPGQGFLAGDTDETWPQFSPDGQWIAFVSNRTGTREVYAKRYPEAGALYQLSDGGAQHPVIWSANPNYIVYLNPGKTEILRVDVEPGDLPRFSKPHKVLDLPAGVQGGFNQLYFSPHPDGQRLLVINSERRIEDNLAVIENWFPQLRELAPTGD